jgi:hypothetical protein
MNDPVPVPTITEADVIAWLASKHAEQKPRFLSTKDTNLSIDVRTVTFTGYRAGPGFDFVCGSGDTIQAAADDFVEKIGSAEKQAAELRVQAAALIAKAVILESPAIPEPAATPVPSTETPAT